MAGKLLDDCFLHDKDRLRHDEALALMTARLAPVAAREDVALGDAAGRILARDVTAPRNIPDFANSAIDGYAVAAASLSTSSDTILSVTMRITAGNPAQAALPAGAAARIFTGAVLPAGADTCIMQEDTERRSADNGAGQVIIPPGIKPGANTRLAGEDVKKGATVLRAGVRLRPQELAAAAATGLARVTCYAPLRVGVISTGDEVIRPGTAAGPGQVYDANHFMLRGLISASGARLHDYGIIADDQKTVAATLARAAGECDVILTSGGASRGETDFIVETISAMGTLTAWQLAIKPGRPLVFGQIGDTVFFGLPGNPVAAFITCLLYANPLLALLQGANWTPPRRYRVPAGFTIAAKKPDRREFWRGWIEDTPEGPRLQKFARDGSGLISSLCRADGLIEVSEETTGVKPGDLLDYIAFTEFGLPVR